MSGGSDKDGAKKVKNLFITIVLNITISVAQVIGGLLSGSMALMSDAAHNFTDVLSLFVSFLAERLSGRKRTLMQTYGFKRAGIFAAFINAATLLIISTILAWESIYRLIHPQPIKGLIVIYFAALGILLNGLSVLLIKKQEEILEQVGKILKEYDIHHFNIQPELSRSDQKELINPGRNR